MRAILAAAALALSAAAAASEPITLTPAELFAAGRLELRAGRADRADGIAEALLARDPADVDALILKAQAADARGRHRDAGIAARRAFRAAEDGRIRYVAARLVARAHAAGGRDTRAQLWLRRAAETAPDARQKAATIRDFRRLRQRNPLAVALSFGTGPTSNLNNGSARKTTDIALTKGYAIDDMPLSPSAQDLSGWEVAAGIGGRYRFHQSARQATDATFHADARRYRLSDDSRASAPDVDAGDFAYTIVGAGLAHRRLLAPRLEVSGSLGMGQSWYGGERFQSITRGAIGASYGTAPGSRVKVKLSEERRASDRGLPTRRKGRLELGWARTLGSDRAKATLGFGALRSDQRIAEYRSATFDLGYDLGRPVAGVGLAWGLGAELRRYDVSNFTMDGRDDRSISAHLSMLFPAQERYGFAPVLTIRGRATESNIRLYDTRTIGVTIGIASTF